MRAIAKEPDVSPVSPPSELGSLRDRKVVLTGRKLTYEKKDPENPNKKVQLDPQSKQLLEDVEQLIRDCEDCRFDNPDFEELILGLEEELFDAFPEADPDRKQTVGDAA